VDWSQCPDAERTPGKVSGAWCVKGTRIPVQAILDNAEDFTAEEIAHSIYDLDLETVRRILRFAYQSEITAIIGPAEPPWPPFSAEAKARLDTLVRKLMALRQTADKNPPR
jgi:uncharacterized protein (DUF433 family)